MQVESLNWQSPPQTNYKKLIPVSFFTAACGGPEENLLQLTRQ